MNIVAITGSPHERGTSALPADMVIRGAQEAGHSVYRFDTACECVHPCTGCDTCGSGEKICAFRDAMDGPYPQVARGPTPARNAGSVCGVQMAGSAPLSAEKTHEL